MVLAIGLVVDDAIVMLENIYRHVEEGMPPIEAAFKGSKEIGFAIVAMTLTLAAVYVPLAFSTGRTGKLFIEFALTLAGAVIVSGFTALTLSPMMCSRLLRARTEARPLLRARRARAAVRSTPATAARCAACSALRWRGGRRRRCWCSAASWSCSRSCRRNWRRRRTRAW